MSQSTTSLPHVEYETTTFTLKDDNLGHNKATLLHARTNNNDSQFYKAILYTHGYSDYFFHDHVSAQFLEHGYDFFALDLRKCGRSIISPEQDQYRHYFADIHEYDEEITLSIEHILKQAQSKTKKLLLAGHSTGGLVMSVYAATGPRRQDIDGLFLNSPYITPLDTSFYESMLEKVLTSLSLSTDIPDNGYNQSISSAHRGEWDFDIKKKPVEKIRVHGPSFHAIRLAQQDLMKRGSCINCPILLMCSNRSLRPDKPWRDEYDEADLFLNVTTMRRAAATMGPYVTIYEIENGRHDLFLSKAPAREKTFTLMFEWIKNLEDKWSIST